MAKKGKDVILVLIAIILFYSMLNLFGDSCSRINDPRKPIREVILIFLPVFPKTIISEQFQKLPVCLKNFTE